MTWGDPCPHSETLIPPPLPSAHSVGSWVTRLPGYPIFLVGGGFPVRDGEALKALLSEAKLE